MPKHPKKTNAVKTTEFVKKANGGSVGSGATASSGVRRLKQSKLPKYLQDGGAVSNEDFIQQTFTGTPPTDQEPGIIGQGVRAAGTQLYENLRQAVQDPKAFHTRALGNIATRLQQDPEGFAMDWTGGGLSGIIRPKGGGNLLDESHIGGALGPLRPRVGGATGRRVSDVMEDMLNVYGPSPNLPAESKEYVERTIKELEPQVALDNWIQTKLGRYIRTEMGTEADPVRKLADEMSEKIRGDYQAGLKRIAKMKEDIAKAKAKGKNTDLSEARLADEIERVDQAFAETSALPIQLGPYTHPSARVGGAREKAGFSPFPISKSSLGKQWEEEADVMFRPYRAGDLIEARSPDLVTNPWISKLDPDTVVYSVGPYVGEMQMFTHTIDELGNALRANTDLPPNLRLKPEDMEQLSIDKAFRHVNKINDWRAQQRMEANLEEANRAAVTVKEYPTSPRQLKWQELKAPTYTELPPGYTLGAGPSGPALYGPDGQRMFSSDPDFPTPPLQQALQFLAKNDLERALKYEGSIMNHCVGGYCDDVYSGGTRIFSLRDKKGEPHVTIETAPADIRREGNTPRDFLLQNGDVGVELGVWPRNESRWPEDIDTFLDDRRNNLSVIQHPKFREWLNSKPAEILQIKGKNNAKPREDYIPFVQDFVRSQQWSRVGDIGNTDLVKLKPEMLSSLQNRGIAVNVDRIAGESYVTKEEFNRLADMMGGVNKYAHGGVVHRAEGSPPTGEQAYPTVRDTLEFIAANKDKLPAKFSEDLPELEKSAMILSRAAESSGQSDEFFSRMAPYYQANIKYDPDFNRRENRFLEGRVMPLKTPNLAEIFRPGYQGEVIPHELEHVLQNRSRRFKDQQSDTALREDLKSMYGLEKKLVERANVLQDDPDVPYSLRAVFSKYAKNTKEPWRDDLDEIYAYIGDRAFLDSTKGIDFLNTNLGKKLFPAPEDRALFFQRVMPGTPSAYPAELPLTPMPEKVDPKASYARQVLQFIKNSGKRP